MTTSAPTRTDGTVQALTRAGIWVLLVLAALNGLFLYFVPGRADTDYAWSILPAVNAAFIGAGFLAGTLATGLVLAMASRWRTFSTLPLRAVGARGHAARGDDHPRGPLQVGLRADLGVGDRLRRRPARRAVPRRPPAARGRPRAGRRSAAAAASAWCRRSSARWCSVGAVALFVAPVELGEHWPWPLTPLLGRAVAAWYALFGTMLLSCALGLRRPAEALIPYATLAAWSVLLLLLPLLHPDDVSGAGLWIALMLALLALSLYALRIAVPERDNL